jgi:DNA-binding NtrC family response regulator
MNQKSGINIQCDIEPHIGRRLEDVERDLIMGTLTRCGGNRTWAAEILGISVRTLRNKMVQYDAAKEIPAVVGRRTREEVDGHFVTLQKFEPGRRLPS